MRARTLLSVALVAAALAGCGQDAPTAASETAAPGEVRREVATDPPSSTTTTGTTTGTTTTQAAGYLGSGNRNDTTVIVPGSGG